MRLTKRQANVLAILNRADDTDIEEGRVAYFRYNEVLRRIAEHYGYAFEEAVAVFAALSPNSDYAGNLRSAVSVLKGYRDGIKVEYIRVSTYNHCRDRAYSYLAGASFLGTTSGKKIRSFYQNILNPLDPHPVTIDGHAVNVWRNKRVNLKAVVVERFDYEAVARDYRAVAGYASILPNQVQAITWFTWKRVNNILYAGRQLELFRDVSNDLWKTLRLPEDIEPFPYLTVPSYTTLRPRLRS